jgi:pimeloyl-ACP methyl ester carboxylesterase
MTASRISRHNLTDAQGSFVTTILEAATPCRVMLFAVGGGGDPERHLPLLRSLADSGCTVVAPHFERMVGPAPNNADLALRGRRLRLALDQIARPELPVAGVGHSIGTTMLLALAGAQAWTRAGRPVPVDPERRLERLVLMAPATDFFRRPGALDAVRTPILAWAGTRDEITPPDQALFLNESLAGRAPVGLRLAEGAGHFSFMNVPPPHAIEPLPDREAFLAGLTEEVCRFVMDG